MGTEEIKLQKQRTLRIRRCILGVAATALLFVCFGIGVWLHSVITDTSENVGQESASVQGIVSVFEAEELIPDMILNAAGKQAADDAREDDNQEIDAQEDENQEIDARKDDVQENDAQETDTREDDVQRIGIQEDGAQEGDAQGTGTQEDGTQEGDAQGTDIQETDARESTSPEEQSYGFDGGIESEFGILVDVEEGTIIAERNPYDRMNPASMTKILTVLTAAEILGIEDESSPVLEDSFTITREIKDYCYVNNCSVAGFYVGENVSVRDLFYGTILPSGADAAVGLATYVSGSHEEFVNRMNEKLMELGFSDTTHIANCVGLYDENHYSTVYDVAMLLKTAENNTFCRQVLSSRTYTTSLTEQHPEGILISNWLLCRFDERDTHGEVLCGKTGYIDQSGRCAATLATDGNGRKYLCVTAGASTPLQCVDDQTALYQKFLPVVE